ncbi:macrophage receptor MARCO-like isoform X4 [Oscarella lobularis]|uniref:macrophage receptor MARCO-like isoform X4 n=1 Tax=Oscarella lobularis TaxID=121494 RepID=UPI0033141923
MSIEAVAKIASWAIILLLVLSQFWLIRRVDDLERALKSKIDRCCLRQSPSNQVVRRTGANSMRPIASNDPNTHSKTVSKSTKAENTEAFNLELSSNAPDDDENDVGDRDQRLGDLETSSRSSLPLQTTVQAAEGRHRSMRKRDTAAASSKSGRRGQKGQKGDKGDRGVQGVFGDRGARGAIGLAGLPGEKGRKGEKGSGYTVNTTTCISLFTLGGDPNYNQEELIDWEADKKNHFSDCAHIKDNNVGNNIEVEEAGIYFVYVELYFDVDGSNSEIGFTLYHEASDDKCSKGSSTEVEKAMITSKTDVSVYAGRIIAIRKSNETLCMYTIGGSTVEQKHSHMGLYRIIDHVPTPNECEIVPSRRAYVESLLNN